MIIDHFNENFKDIFPKEIQVYTSYGTFKYNIGDFTREGDIVRVVYHGCSAEKTGDVLSDGEPDFIGFDIHFINNSRGKKTLIDITYGDHVVSEFSIESPNKVSVIHYDGVGSKADRDTHFGFDDKSLQDIVNLFNKFDKSYKLSTKDFTFIDKYPDTYNVKESAKISPISENETILIVDNSNPETHKYVNNLLNYLRTRGINNNIVIKKEDIKKVDKKIIGVILSGSEYRINQHKLDVNDYVLENLKCPILGICFGFQSICKHYGGDIKEGDKHHEHRKLSKYRKHKLFDGLDVNKTQFSFSFNDYPTSCPNGFKVLSLIDDNITGICNDSKKIYGVLFHPEDLERTHVVIDNFLSMCHHGQDEIENLKQGKFQIKNYKQFVESKNYLTRFK